MVRILPMVEGASPAGSPSCHTNDRCHQDTATWYMQRHTWHLSGQSVGFLHYWPFHWVPRSNGSLAAFYLSFIDLVELLLGLIRASQHCDWLHLLSIRRMIVFDTMVLRLWQAKLCEVHVLNGLLQSGVSTPTSTKPMMAFSVQLSDGNTYGKILVDQTIEATVHKDPQTTGDTKASVWTWVWSVSITCQLNIGVCA